MRKHLIGQAIVCVAVTAFAGDLLHCRTKAIRLCKIPRYGYFEHTTTSPPIVAISALPMTIESVVPPQRASVLIQGPQLSSASPDAVVVVPNPNAAAHSGDAIPLRGKVFQFETTALQLDHCAVSNIALTLREDGSWFANFVVTQNPGLVPNEVRPIAERFVRNRFYLKFQPLALAPNPPDVPRLGEPQPFVLEVAPFWVEKGKTRSIQLGAQQFPAAREYFESIRRVQVEFRYE